MGMAHNADNSRRVFRRYKSGRRCFALFAGVFLFCCKVHGLFIARRSE